MIPEFMSLNNFFFSVMFLYLLIREKTYVAGHFAASDNICPLNQDSKLQYRSVCDCGELDIELMVE
jgi:hypothetical protein